MDVAGVDHRVTFPEVLAIVRRQWRIVIAVVAVAGIAMVTLPGDVESAWRADGNVVLLSSATAESAAGGRVEVNPWSQFGNTQAIAASALVELMRSADVKQTIESDPAIVTYGVGINPNGSGAIIDLTVTAATAEKAMSAWADLASRVERNLRSLQRATGAPETTWLTLGSLTTPTKAEELPASNMRAIGAIGVLGLAAALAAALGADKVASLMGERARRSERPEAEQPGDRNRSALAAVSGQPERQAIP